MHKSTKPRNLGMVEEPSTNSMMSESWAGLTAEDESALLSLMSRSTAAEHHEHVQKSSDSRSE